MATPEQRLVTEAALSDSWPTGTGSPEGTISAPAGTIYTDTTSSNPMLRHAWIKRTDASTATGWDIIRGTVTRTITSLCTGVTAGAVYLEVSDGWTGLRFNGAMTAGGTVEILAPSGPLAPYAPLGVDRFSVANMNLALPAKIVQVESSGRVVFVGAGSTDKVTGSIWWPRARALPTTWIGA